MSSLPPILQDLENDLQEKSTKEVIKERIEQDIEMRKNKKIDKIYFEKRKNRLSLKSGGDQKLAKKFEEKIENLEAEIEGRAERIKFYVGLYEDIEAGKRDSETLDLKENQD